VLKFKLLTIEKGRTLKRHHAGSKGMAKPILKRFAHIKIILESEQVVQPFKRKKGVKTKKVEKKKNTKEEKNKEKKSDKKTVKKETPKKEKKVTKAKK